MQLLCQLLHLLLAIVQLLHVALQNSTGVYLLGVQFLTELLQLSLQPGGRLLFFQQGRLLLLQLSFQLLQRIGRIVPLGRILSQCVLLLVQQKIDQDLNIVAWQLGRTKDVHQRLHVHRVGQFGQVLLGQQLVALLFSRLVLLCHCPGG
uniref:Putative secreted protein n=1 Tax=Anopheles darlingi TaxID=43151 RepID=A0A2M4D1R4_ANODA